MNRNHGVHATAAETLASMACTISTTTMIASALIRYRHQAVASAVSADTTAAITAAAAAAAAAAISFAAILVDCCLWLTATAIDAHHEFHLFVFNELHW